ncbi:MAG: ASPIC/UnbV domain-containing protein, partial [Planctomycetota bacterium]
SCGFVHHQEGRGLANADLDNDGDQDLIVFSNRGRLRVFTNDLDGDDTNWLRVFVDTGANPRLAPNGFGTLVRIATGGQAQRRVLSGGCNYMSQSELSAHFGLGSSVLVDELRVEWNDGTVTVMEDVLANQTITVTAPYAADLDGNGVVNIQDFLRLLAAWGNGDGPADLNADGVVDNGDFQVLLLNWS